MICDALGGKRYPILFPLSLFLFPLSLAQAQKMPLADEVGEEDDVDLNSDAVILIEGKKHAGVVPGHIVVDAEQAAEIAGVQGDALKSLSVVAGVARPSSGTQNLSIWGADSADTRIYIDDIPIPRLFHFGGIRSVIPSSEIATFELTPGGAGSRYGRGIGGVIAITSAGEEDKPMWAQLHLDPMDIAMYIGGRFNETSWIRFGGRSSVLAQSFAAVAPQTQSVFAIPEYWDFQVRGAHVLDDGQSLQFFATAVGDLLRRSIPTVNADQMLREDSTASFARLGMTLKRSTELTSRQITIWVGRDESTTEFDDGTSNAFAKVQGQAAGLLITKQQQLRRWLNLHLGLDGEIRLSQQDKSGALSLPPREGDDFVFGQPPGNRVNQDNWNNVFGSFGVFADAEIDVSPQLRIRPGLRLEPSILSGNRVVPVRPSEPRVGYTELQWTFSPRLHLAYQVASAWQLFAATGNYRQPPAAADLSPVFGTPILKQANSWQFLLGTEVRATPWLSWNGQLFANRQSQLAVRDSLATPAIASLLTSKGQGQVVGAQLSVAIAPDNGYSGNLNYTLMRSLRRNDATGDWREFDENQTHILRALVRWQSAWGLSVGTRLELSSGFPRTPVVGAIFNAGSQQFDPLLGETNSIHLPYFVELSAHISYQNQCEWGSYRLWLDVINVSHHKNVEEQFYSADYTQKQYIHSLPFLPTVGVQVQL